MDDVIFFQVICFAQNGSTMNFWGCFFFFFFFFSSYSMNDVIVPLLLRHFFHRSLAEKTIFLTTRRLRLSQVLN